MVDNYKDRSLYSGEELKVNFQIIQVKNRPMCELCNIIRELCDI
jgi:hypothetical protein